MKDFMKRKLSEIRAVTGSGFIFQGFTNEKIRWREPMVIITFVHYYKDASKLDITVVVNLRLNKTTVKVSQYGDPVYNDIDEEIDGAFYSFDEIITFDRLARLFKTIKSNFKVSSKLKDRLINCIGRKVHEKPITEKQEKVVFKFKNPMFSYANAEFDGMGEDDDAIINKFEKIID